MTKTILAESSVVQDNRTIYVDVSLGHVRQLHIPKHWRSTLPPIRLEIAFCKMPSGVHAGDIKPEQEPICNRAINGNFENAGSWRLCRNSA